MGYIYYSTTTTLPPHAEMRKGVCSMDHGKPIVLYACALVATRALIHGARGRRHRLGGATSRCGAHGQRSACSAQRNGTSAPNAIKPVSCARSTSVPRSAVPGSPARTHRDLDRDERLGLWQGVRCPQPPARRRRAAAAARARLTTARSA
jgi:hypothetical protein